MRSGIYTIKVVIYKIHVNEVSLYYYMCEPVVFSLFIFIFIFMELDLHQARYSLFSHYVKPFGVPLVASSSCFVVHVGRQTNQSYMVYWELWAKIVHVKMDDVLLEKKLWSFRLVSRFYRILLKTIEKFVFGTWNLACFVCQLSMIFLILLYDLFAMPGYQKILLLRLVPKSTSEYLKYNYCRASLFCKLDRGS